MFWWFRDFLRIQDITCIDLVLFCLETYHVHANFLRIANVILILVVSIVDSWYDVNTCKYTIIYVQSNSILLYILKCIGCTSTSSFCGWVNLGGSEWTAHPGLSVCAAQAKGWPQILRDPDFPTWSIHVNTVRPYRGWFGQGLLLISK